MFSQCKEQQQWRSRPTFRFLRLFLLIISICYICSPSRFSSFVSNFSISLLTLIFFDLQKPTNLLTILFLLLFPPIPFPLSHTPISFHHRFPIYGSYFSYCYIFTLPALSLKVCIGCHSTVSQAKARSVSQLLGAANCKLKTTNPFLQTALPLVMPVVKLISSSLHFSLVFSFTPSISFFHFPFSPMMSQIPQSADQPDPAYFPTTFLETPFSYLHHLYHHLFLYSSNTSLIFLLPLPHYISSSRRHTCRHYYQVTSNLAS